ncbi:MAG: hypothetical protein CMO26_01870 [Thiotrichales bacterium]|nr:hypothetical protein [Thiotrichales bacterium]
MEDIDTWLHRVYEAGGDRDTLDRVYDDWAERYDQHLWGIGNPFTAIAAAFISRHLQSFDARILDAGCGTGNAAQLLHQIGYRNLSGFDPSPGMLEVARRKQIFQHLFEHALGVGETVSDHYDCLVATGVLTSGHAPPAALDDMLAMIRTGGLLVFSVSRLAEQELGFAAKMHHLDEAGAWQLVEHSRWFDAHPFLSTEAPVELRIYVYRKLA